MSDLAWVWIYVIGFGLLFSIPVFLVALVVCLLFPDEATKIATGLILAEATVAVAGVYYLFMANPGATGLEFLIVPSLLLAALLGNIVAVAMGHRVRNAFGSR